MPEYCKIPQNVIDEALGHWESLVEQAYEVFGVDCDLIYSGKTSKVIASGTNNVPELTSINARRYMGDLEYDIEDQTVYQEEVSETVRIRIYWDAKDWATVYGLVRVPENQVMMLAHLEDAEKLSQAIRIKFTSQFGKVYIFTRVSQPVPYGFGKDKYCSSIWEHSS